MKNCYLPLIVIFLCQSILSQEKNSFTLTGTIFSDSVAIENAHIINKTTLKGTISNKLGEFTLPVKVGDTLFISHINYSNKHILISIADKIIKKRTIDLFVKTHALEEVTIRKKRSIFYVDPQIMPKSVVNASTLKLPYANVIAKKDKRITKLTLTSASVNLTNLINFFNGKAKKAKELKEAKLRDRRLDNIRKQFTDYFFVHQLKIEKQYINQFLNYCLHSGIIKQYQTGNRIKLTEFLLIESKTFPHRQIESDTLLTKK